MEFSRLYVISRATYAAWHVLGWLYWPQANAMRRKRETDRMTIGNIDRY